MSTPITLLDGGMGQELQRRGLRDRVLWSTRALIDRPEAVQQLHEEYIALGADVITTNTYSCTPMHFERVEGLTSRAVELLELAGHLAASARETAGRAGVKIAASIPPVDESYRPDLVRSADEMAEWYGVMVESLRPFVDIWLCETMSSIREAEAALMSTAGESAPTWVAWTLTDHRTACLRSGEALGDAVHEAHRHHPAAVLVNCCQPQTVTAAMPTLRDTARSLPFGAYANGFPPMPEDFGPETEFDDHETPSVSSYAEHARAWMSAGATIIGGCCDIGPDHMSAVASSVV